ncbi:MAG: phage major capsid protein [Rhodoferax sp.]|nr:phage major capsid protein [Rhodoferax sp.]
MSTATLTRLFGRPVGLTEREAADYGPAAYIEAVVRRDQAAIQRFREVSELTRATHGRPADNLNFVALPPDALVGVARRDMSAAGVAGSNYLIGTEQPAFIETLRSRSLVGRLPITTIDCTGHANLPALGATTTGWLPSENDENVDAAITIGAVAATPKYVSARFTVSHQLNRQMGEAGRRALDTEVALGVDAAMAGAILAGSGSDGQPTGLVNTSGIGSQSGGTIAWSAVATLQAGVDAYDTGDCSWVIGSGASAVLRARTREAGSGRFVFDSDGIAGKPVIVHSSAPSTTAVVGCWRRLALAVWGPLEIAIDPYSAFASGKITVAVRQAVDVVPLSIGAFGKAEGVS